MKSSFKKYFSPLAVVAAIAISASTVIAQPEADSQALPSPLPAPVPVVDAEKSSTDVASPDTGRLIYPLAKPEIVTYDDLQQKSPADLRDPSNVRHEVDYDPDNGYYIYRTKVGDMEVATPFVLDAGEYSEQSLKESMNAYWNEKNASNTDKGNKFSLEDMHVDIGPVGDKIFGEGGVSLKTQGSVDLTFGLKHTRRDNPTIAERNRKTNIFDFDTKIQLNATGKVGDRLKFNMNYNTEATFDFDQSLINLSYEGKEDNIIKKVEAGNVTLPLSTQLITGANALFGVRTDMQFGKLRVSALAAQQQSERKNISTKGGAQTTEFEIKAADYEANRHFFLSQFFYDNYDEWMSKAPTNASGVVINKVEVWVTSTSSSAEKTTRNVIAFTDLGEPESNPSKVNPNNSANKLYSTLNSGENVGIRNYGSNQLEMVQYNGKYLENGIDYEVVNSARMLSPDEFKFNPYLGTVSLRSTLNPSDVCAVAFQYTYKGKSYKVGELSTDRVSSDSTSSTLFVKLLKSTSNSPSNPRLWKLMMKNVYSLAAYNVSPEKFKLDIEYYYSNDSISSYLKYLPISNIKKTPLIKVLNLDRLNSKHKAVSDGYFDFVDGYTVDATNGRIYLPSVEPFGSGLINKIDDKELAKQYAFTELYELTQSDAKEYAEKDKFILTGEYRSSSGSQIRLGATNVPRGSVKVSAGGRTLVENEGYTVDYNMGVVTILDEVALSSNTPINVSLESESFFDTQRKSLLGTTLQYDFNDHFTFGGTLMHLNEKPYTQKVSYGDEPISNTIWGLNAAYNTPSQWLTDMVDKLPLINATVPSTIAVSGEFAQLIPGHAAAVDGEGNGVSYIDDFEGTKSSINIMSPLAWSLASTPVVSDATYVGNKFIRESDAVWGSKLTGVKGHLGYGMNRAHFAWYRIDQVLNNKSKDTPKSLANDNDEMSNNLVRIVHENELYPLKQRVYGESSILPTLNLSFYPQERGPYNFDISGLNADGTLANPETRWGGIMRKIENSDFNKANVAYIEFWMMDPFDEFTLARNPNVNLSSGKLVFNLGEVSEDILKDGRISFENGMPTNDMANVVDTTIWGRVPRIQAITYAFDNANIEQQDVGLDGLSTYDEHQYEIYKFYLNEIKKKLNSSALARFDADIHSPLNDPAGDNFSHFLGDQYALGNGADMGILYRYKYYNGMEGNSSSSSSNYSSSTNAPDVEDLNGDHTLNEKEQYFEYVVDIDKHILENESQWASHFIASKVSTNQELKDGNVYPVTWYQFKIPIDAYNRKEGSISNFQSIRYIRMYMTGFSTETHLRFGAMNLVRTDWRVYSQNKNLFEASYNDGIDSNGGSGSISVSSVNIENDADKSPVPYDLPPGVSRVIDPSQTQVREENEQSMLISLDSLGTKQARAVYKKTSLDMRRYERLRMFVHAEDKDELLNPTGNNHLFLFLRMGSDLTENYYEYQIPLTITPRGSRDKYAIWPESNNIDFAFSTFTNLKKQRDKAKAAGRVHINERYTENDRTNGNLITVIGTPSFGEITAMMIGVRNEDKVMHSADIWVNELRMVGFDEEGGCAGLGNLGIVFSDLGSISLGGRVEQAGFGSIEDNVDSRRTDDYYEYNFSANVQLGKLFPEKAKVNLPFSYTLEKTVSKPKYDPLNSDLTLEESIENQTSERAKDSVRDMSVTTTTFHSYTLNNVRVGITSEKPMPYDPANFSFSLGYNETTEKSPEVQYDVTRNYNGLLNYSYNLNLKPVEPFKKAKLFKSNYLKLIREFNFNYLPNSYAFSTNMKRYYNEVQLRDYTTVIEHDTTFPYLAWDKDWTWSRTSDIKWNLSRSLKLSFSSAMNSQIDEIFRDENGNYRDVPVNKSYLREVNADDWYERWKDTVWSSIKHFGTPIEYNQRFTANWNIPINKLPYLDWVTSNAQFASDYTWDRGAETLLGQRSETGNIAFSKRQWNGDVRFNFETLYNKSNYLKEINKRFSNNKPRTGKKGPAKDDKKLTKEEKRKAKQAEKEAEAKRKEEESKPKVYERKNIRLRKDNKTRISHRLGTTKLTVTLTDKDGKAYPVKFKVVDQNVINLIGTEDVSNLSLRVVGNQKQRTPLSDALDLSVRILMSVRNLSVTYREVDALTLTGYHPESGFLGQDRNAPGYDFTFGFYKADKYMKKAKDHGWMLEDSAIVTNPVIKTREQDLQVKSSVIPFPGVKIDLNAAWMKTRVDDIYLMYDDANTFTGSYSRTHIAIKTAFKGKTLNSKLFNNFLSYRHQVRSRVKSDFIRNTGITDAGEYQDKLSANSSDVLVPAFLAAYTGSSPSSQKLDLLPNIWSMLPNWRVSVDLLSRWEYMQNYLKSLTLSHAYKCTYNVNSYSSLTDWTDLGGGYGEVAGTSPELDNGYFSTQYTVDNVNINESFSPLLGAEATLKNSLMLKAEVKRSRTNSLDVNALQVVESYSNEYVFGAGYRLDDFGAIVRLSNNKQKTIKNDLNLRLDVSYKLTDAYIRKIEDMYSQLSSGINSFIIKFSADYVVSSRLNVRFYYDRTASTPKVSTSYPMVSSDFGIGVKILLSK
ncbi:MAG: cell surface protein SprA [Paludibacteraceae bacterium]|nr:cell surface protein SprA [Paludibacteraceae bacterium]